MNAGQQRRVALLGRVSQFALTHASAFPDGSQAKTYLQEVNNCNYNASQFGTQQTAGSKLSKAATAQKKMGTKQLRANLAQLVGTAKQAFKGQPQIANQFRMPRGGTPKLFNAANALVALCTKYKAQLVAYNLPADMEGRIGGNIYAMQSAMNTQSAGGQSRSGGTKTLEMCLRKGLSSVRSLDPIVKNFFAGQTDVLAQWATASRLQAAPKRKPKPIPPTPVFTMLPTALQPEPARVEAPRAAPSLVDHTPLILGANGVALNGVNGHR